MLLRKIIQEASYCEDMRAPVIFITKEGIRHQVESCEIRMVKRKVPIGPGIELEYDEEEECVHRFILRG